ncbi:MAG: hypothetical protein ACQERB_02660 [Promethearchaeati archaeon]
MSEQAFQARINELEKELEEKTRDINQYLDRIEQLENNVLKLEGLIEEAESEGGFDREKVQETKLSIELDQKERELRELKNKMGFLRKEKIELQKQIEKGIPPKNESTVIRIKEKTESGPFEALVKELQNKINKQQIVIDKLKKGESINEIDSGEIQSDQKTKDQKIVSLQEEISQLKAQLETKEKGTLKGKTTDTITKSLTEELQDKLNKTKRQVKILYQHLSKYEDVENVSGFKNIKDEVILTEEDVNQLKRQLNDKTRKIKELEKRISDLENTKSDSLLNNVPLPNSGMISELTDELQKKLNKAKIRINELETQLKQKTEGKQVVSKIDDKLKNTVSEKNDLIDDLKSKLLSKEELLLNKQEEIEAIKNEAMRCNSEIENLQEKLATKDQQIKNLNTQIKTITQQSENEISEKSTNLLIRIQELKSLVNELKKENTQHLIEIAELRK